jgi:hypothetical protein
MFQILEYKGLHAFYDSGIFLWEGMISWIHKFQQKDHACFYTCHCYELIIHTNVSPFYKLMHGI